MSHLSLITPILLVLAAFVSFTSLVMPRRLRGLYAKLVLVSTQSIVLLLLIDGFIRTVILDEEPLVYMMGGWPPPLGITYIGDSLSYTLSLMVWVALSIALLANWASGLTLSSKIVFQVFALALEAGLLGAVFAADFFHLFVTWEVSSVATVGLALASGLNRRVVEAAFKYALSSTLATTLYMFIVALVVYGTYGTLSIPDYLVKVYSSSGIAGVSGGLYGDPELAVGLLLLGVIVAFGLSAGLFPLHFWMPDLYERVSTPAAIALAGGKEIVAFYVVARILYTIHGDHPYGQDALEAARLILLILGVTGIVYGGLSLLAIQSFRRMLAYYLVMDAGIIFATLSAGSSKAIEAFAYLAASHLASVIALFSYAFLVEKGFSCRACAMISSLLAAGLPPFASFFGKLLAIDAMLGNLTALALLLPSLIASSIAPLSAVLRYRVEEKPISHDYIKTYTVLMTAGLALSLALAICFTVVRDFLLEPLALDALDSEKYIGRALSEAIRIYESYWPSR